MGESLFNISNEYIAALYKLNDADLDDQTVIDTLESLRYPVEEKSVQVGMFIRNIESEADQIEQAIDMMNKRLKSKRNNVKRLKAYLLANLQTAGISKVESPYFVLSVRNNPESVVVDAESQIPPDYMREIPATYEPDKNLIKQAIKDGFEVPGCHLTKTQSVQIK